MTFKDLTQINVGNKDHVSAGLTNINKIRRLECVLQKILSLQRQKYDIVPVHGISKFLRSVSICCVQHKIFNTSNYHSLQAAVLSEDEAYRVAQVIQQSPNSSSIDQNIGSKHPFFQP